MKFMVIEVKINAYKINIFRDIWNTRSSEPLDNTTLLHENQTFQNYFIVMMNTMKNAVKL